MTRSPGWMHPRRRHKRYLGPCELTYHALDSYRLRISPDARWDQLEKAARTSYLIGMTPTGMYVYRGDGCRFIVHKAAKRLPVVLTVLAGEEGRHG